MSSQFTEMFKVLRLTQMFGTLAIIVSYLLSTVTSAPILDSKTQGSIRGTVLDQLQISERCGWGEFLNSATQSCDKCQIYCKDGPDSIYCPATCIGYLNRLEVEKINKTNEEKPTGLDDTNEESHSTISNDSDHWVVCGVVFAVCAIVIILFAIRYMKQKRTIGKLRSNSSKVHLKPIPPSSRSESESAMNQPDIIQIAQNGSPHQQQDPPHSTENQPFIKQTADASQQQVQPVMRNHQDPQIQTARPVSVNTQPLQVSSDKNPATISDNREEIETLELNMRREPANQ